MDHEVHRWKPTPFFEVHIQMCQAWALTFATGSKSPTYGMVSPSKIGSVPLL